MAQCDWCKEEAVTSVTIREGDKPENPKQENSMSDTRRVGIIRACDAHKSRLDPKRFIQ